MSEASCELGEEDPSPPPQGQDIEGLQQQFEHQQTLISQLKGALQSNEEQLASKEKEMEEYAAKLSSIKSRTKASKRNVKSGEKKSTSEGEAKEKKERLDSASTSTESTSKVEERIEPEGEAKDVRKTPKNSEKAKLLRKKLEENRMKFEQRGKELSESKKGIEEMVEHLRMQLEERDQVIQSLQQGLQSTPGVGSSQVAQEAEPIPPEVYEHADKKEMYAQIVYKDNKIVELNNRLLELELSVLDLQENLKEKDAVIDARTKAITLMSEDMSRKSKTTLDTLDDTREQMRLMQNNFIILEGRMKEEEEQLKKQLEEKDRKLKYVEENYKKLESIRFELTTSIAELQEKVVHLQTMNSALHKQAEETRKERGAKGEKHDQVEELIRALDESNKQLLKVKAQHKNKVKSLTKQIESLKKVSESSDEILRLQQRVAELEEDKATERSWKDRIQELEEKVKQQNEDLDNHVHALSQLESEKLNLIEDLQEDKMHLSRLEKELKVLGTKLTETENLKVTSEMKAVELEELVDAISNEKRDLQQENEKLIEDKSEYKQLVDSLQQEKVDLLEEITNLQALLKESNPGDTDSNRSEFQMVSSNNSDEEKWKRLPTPEETLAEEKHVKDSSNVELYVKLLESELEDARRVIAEEKDTIHDLKIKLESKEEEVEMHLEVISKLEQLGREVSAQEDVGDVNKLSEILNELNEMTGDLEEWKKRCSEVEDRLKSLEDEKVILEGKLEEVTNENSLLNAQLSLQKQVSEELVLKLKESNKVVFEKDETIKALENKIAETQTEKNVFDNSELDGGNSSDYNVQNEIISLKAHLEALKKDCEFYKNEISSKDAELLNLTSELRDKCTELEQKSAEAEQSVNVQNELQQKETVIKQLRIECEELRQNLEILNSNFNESTLLVGTLSENSDRIQKLEQLLSDKDKLLSERESELESSYQKSKSLTDKVKKLAVNLKAKTVVLQNLEEREKKCVEDIQEKDEMISKLNLEINKISAEIETLRVQCVEKDKCINDLSEKIESNVLVQGTKIEELVVEKEELVSLNENLKRDLNMAMEKLDVNSHHVEESRLLLTNQISELEKEVNNLRNELYKKGEEMNFFEEECKKVSILEGEKHYLEESITYHEKKNKELIAEIMKKEDELAEVSLKLDELSKTIEIKNELIEMNSVKYKELEQIIVTKDMQVTAVEDRMSTLQNSWSALEAKLQEREAFIESLEQELAKSRSHHQHLEEGLSFIEDRRRSLESKFAALGEQLQESDRIKEEAEEHESELAQRLAALASSEEVLRKRLVSLNENNVELSQKVSELTLENEDLKKNVAHTDNNIKMANKEIERLSMCESGYHQALETIEKLERDMKKRTTEFERSFKEKELQSSKHVENLELDMKNLSQQLEILDAEKRSAMEHCETLNDIKLNLEDDIESLQEKVDSYHAKIIELENVNKQRELELNSTIAEKQAVIVKLEQKIGMLEEDIRNVPVSLSNESEGSQMQENMNSNSYAQLKSEMETVTKLLAQKESELQSYQNRLLQLQFGNQGAGNSVTVEDDQSSQRKQLESSVIEMQEKLTLKDSQLEELKVLLESASGDMSNMQLQISLSCKKIEEMSHEMCHLQEIVKIKDNQLQSQMETISQITNSDKLSQQLESINSDYQTQLTVLQQQNSQLHKELVHEKATNIVTEIVSAAQTHVREQRNELRNKTRSSENRVQFSEKVYCIPLQSEDQEMEGVQVHEDSLSDSIAESKSSSEGVIMDFSEYSSESNSKQELVEKLRDLRAELEIVKSDRAHALIKAKEFELEVNRLLDIEKQLNDVQGRFEVFVASHGEVGRDHFSKESSIDSECTAVKTEYHVDVFQNEDKLKITAVKEFDHEKLQTNLYSQQTPTSELVDIADSAWTGGILEEEEGWGWGAEEARLEEEHMERQKAALGTSPVHSELEQHVLELENKIELLEREKNQIGEELKASQIRSGKMLKKLKDLKLKNESLMRENQELAVKKTSEFGGLDLAIEEELKIRIDDLEKELKECKGERDTMSMEKEGLQRRMEILTATNERLAERELQGINIDYWQNKNKELNNQIESLQWRIEELMEERETEDSANKELNLQELQEQIAALAADNEQLQNMLEEQRNLRVAAETSLKDVQQFASSKEANFLQEADVKENYMALRENYDILCKELETLRSSTVHDSLIAENAVLRENYDVLRRELENIRSNSNSDIIAAEYSSMRNNFETMYSELEELRSRVDVNNTLQANYESLQMAHDQLISEMNHMQKEYCNVTEKYEIIVREKSQLQDDFSEKSKTAQINYEIMMTQLEREKSELLMQYEKASSEFTLISGEMQHLKDEIEKYKSIVASMTEEQEKLNELNYSLNEKYAAVTNELLILKDELEKYKNMIATMTQEQQKLNEVNCALNEKYEDLISSNSMISNKSLDESRTNIFSSQETFPTFQLFSQTNKETITDEVEKISIQTQVQDIRDESEYIKQIEDYKVQILELEKVKQQKTEELDVLRAMFSNEQEEWGNMEQNLSKKVEILEGELETVKEAAKRESELRESLTLKEHELSNIKSQLLYMEEELTKTQHRVEELEAQLILKDEEFQNTNQKFENQEIMIQQLLTSKELELNKVHEALVLKNHEQQELLLSEVNDLKLHISDREIEIEHLMIVKDQDLQNLKIQLSDVERKAQTDIEENEKNIQMLHEQLSQNKIEIQNLSQVLKEKELQVIELQEVLEAREDEIREAVLQIRDRNIEIQQLKQSRDMVVESISSTQIPQDTQVSSESQSESSQNELDLALYMLHQRDVRCEELTLELMQLLAERDTLQLRLSTALRINEELRHKMSKSSVPSSPLRVPAAHPEPDTLSSVPNRKDATEQMIAPIDPEPVTGSTAVAIEEPREDLKVLADKLSQLHSVDYRRDVTLQDEREQRHSEQVRLLQPRGPGVLVESNYTLSRDVQSPSTVLLNWIWGRSTPKVLHI